jgi:RNA polymerase sigma factor (TIGR02999 family)
MAPNPKTDEIDAAYSELRRIARFHMRGERADHTLQATELVHETYLILATRSHLDWSSRADIVALAVTVMRHFLIDYAKKRTAQKHGGGQDIKVPLNDFFAYSSTDYCNLITVDRFLNQLEQELPKAAKVLELRIFGGYSQAEIAEFIGRDIKTVQRYWNVAQKYLRDRLGEK